MVCPPEKIPIHYRNSKKSLAPSTVFSGELGHQASPQEEDEVRSHGGSAHVRGITRHHKNMTFLPGDRVTFTENPLVPGIPIVFRTPDERASNPDRLNLDRRKLTVCPTLEGEEQLRLLNYQHNFITQIQHLESLKRLIFLDLYDNHVEEISGLSSLKSLRVLMLGRNRIKKIENVEALVKLDVLDLHGNQISKIENLSHLSELRVLNLAGNLITHVDDVRGMYSLAELNLRRNRIRTVVEINTLPNLQRLFLSFNDITSFEDIQCLGDSVSLSEITLDNNPLCQESSYRQTVLKCMQQLKQLDMKNISEEERRVALVTARKEEDRRRELNKIAILKEKRRVAISNARRQWETMQGSLSQTGRLLKVNQGMTELYANHIGSVPNTELLSPFGAEVDNMELESLTSSDLRSRPDSAYSTVTDTESPVDDGRRERVKSAGRKREAKIVQRNSGGAGDAGMTSGTTIIGDSLNMLEQIEGDTLSLYGLQSLDAFDRNWGIQAAGVVTVIIFKFIDFDAIVRQLPKIRVRFPATQTLIFCSTNIHSLQQINALSLVRRLDNLTIDLNGNPVTKFTLWRLYAVFRLAHFPLRKINDVEVSSSDIVNAEKLFGPLSHTANTQLSQHRLLSLTGDAKRKAFIDGKKLGEMGKLTGDKTQVEWSGRASLGYMPTESKQDTYSKKNFSHNYVADLTKEALFSERKRIELLKIWPSLITEMVQDALSDMVDMEAYMKRSLEVLDKS
ncbi:hypothetical protein BsWGS_00175 [Bradybaena similaris]